MSMCLRKKLEEFIIISKSNISKLFAETKREALIQMDMDKVSEIENLEKMLKFISPIPTKYTPHEYIMALRTHSLILSIANQLTMNAAEKGIRVEIENAIRELINLLSSGQGMDFGSVITKGRELLSRLDAGEEIFIESCRRYLVSIIVGCGFRELSEKEKHLLGEIIAHKILKSEKPFITTQELSLLVSLDEKKVRNILSDLVKIYPNIIVKDTIVATTEKIERWTQSIMENGEGEEHLDELKRVFPNHVERAYLKNVKRTLEKLESLVG